MIEDHQARGLTPMILYGVPRTILYGVPRTPSVLYQVTGPRVILKAHGDHWTRIKRGRSGEEGAPVQAIGATRDSGR